MLQSMHNNLTIPSVENFIHELTLSHTSPCFTCLLYKFFENTVGKGAIECNKQFLLFHGVFYPFEELSAIFIKFKNYLLQTLSVWKSMNLLFGKAFRIIQTLQNCKIREPCVAPLPFSSMYHEMGFLLSHFHKVIVVKIKFG